MRRTMLAAAILALAAATSARTQAETIVSFSYAGRGGPDSAGLIATGAGTFSFANGLSTVGLADLTSFNFTLDENTPNTAKFGLANLTSFSASLGAGAAPTGLALATGAVQGTNPTTEPREFDVSSLDPSGASTSYVFLGFPISQTTGTVTITSVVVAVPEPPASIMAAAGALFVAGCAWARRRKGDHADVSGRFRLESAGPRG